MPELPDLTVLSEAFETALTGRVVTAVTVLEPLVVRATPTEMEGLLGQQLTQVEQRGKFLIFSFARDRLVVNAMLTGRLGLAAPGSRAFPKTAAVVAFDRRTGEQSPSSGPPARRSRRRKPPAWTRRPNVLPPDDEPVELRYRDATRMGKLYLTPHGLDRPVAGWSEQGPDADDPTLDLDAWRGRLRRHSGELKSVLRNQEFVAGIGNAYSDEILWAARLAPFRKRSSLAPEEMDALYHATRDVLARATDQLRDRVPPRFEVEVRDFLQVHGKGGQPCPRCGARLSEISAGGFVTTFCRSCQG
ncbi:MAG: hypothetical protein H0X16_06635 [Chloroflexi bacterium]|nr:hypothetical protein [Chloroflexota bacterium]